METNGHIYEYIAQNIRYTMMFYTDIYTDNKKDPPWRKSDHFHRHAWSELFFVEKGEMTLNFEGKRAAARAGEFALVSPKALHYAEYGEDMCCACSFSVAYLEKSMSEKILRSFLDEFSYRIFRADELSALLMKRIISAAKKQNGVAAGSSLAALLVRAAEICAVVYSEKHGKAIPRSCKE